MIIYLGFSSIIVGCSTLQKEKNHHIAVSNSADRSKTNHGKRFAKPYSVKGKTYYPLATSKGYRAVGMASWYGAESGNRTATGDHFSPEGLTAAHKTLPLPTRVRVTNLENGHATELLVNDRGPFIPGRLIDLSHGAARRLKMHQHGTCRVLVEALN